MLFYLSQNPEAYKTLSEETRSTFSNGKQISSGSILRGCKYLRISPPVTGTL